MNESRVERLATTETVTHPLTIERHYLRVSGLNVTMTVIGVNGVQN